MTPKLSYNNPDTKINIRVSPKISKLESMSTRRKPTKERIAETRRLRAEHSQPRLSVFIGLERLSDFCIVQTIKRWDPEKTNSYTVGCVLCGENVAAGEAISIVFPKNEWMQSIPAYCCPQCWGIVVAARERLRLSEGYMGCNRLEQDYLEDKAAARERQR